MLLYGGLVVRPYHDHSWNVLDAANNLLETIDENFLVNGVGEPGVLQGTSGEGSIDTDATTGGDTSGEV